MKKTEGEKNGPDAGEVLYKTTGFEKGFRKAAQFLLLLEKKAAANVLAHLNEEEVEGIMKEIVAISQISSHEAKRLFAEYGVTPPDEKSDAPVTGGFVKASEMLAAAVGEERSRAILERVEGRLPSGHFDFLKSVDESAILTLLGDESSQVVALVLSQIEPSLASKILVALPQPVQKAVVHRIAKMEKVLPEILRRTADALKKKLFTSQDLSSQHIDGKKTLQNILKHMNFGSEKTIIDSLSEAKPELAQELEKSLFTLDVFYKIPAKQLQIFLRGLSDRSLAMILKGEPEKFREFVLASISGRRKELVLEEARLLGEVPKRDADREKQEVLASLKFLIDQGKMTVLEENDRIIF